MANVTCPTCGDTFETEHAMKTHHGRLHDHSIKGVEVKCSNCEETFRKVRPHVEKHDNHFCSRSCMAEYRRERVETECDNCGAEMSIKPHRAEKSTHQYCSRDCLHQHKSELARTSVDCSHCGTTLDVLKWHEKRQSNFFCDKACEAAWISQKRVGEGHPQFKGHERYYGENWRSARKQALERDGYECVRCGLSREEQYENTGKDLNVHHKTPLREFDDKTDANHLDNLETLCSKCHFEVDQSMRANISG